MASRQSEHLPTTLLHAVMPGMPRTMCALDLGEGLEVLPGVTWESVGGRPTFGAHHVLPAGGSSSR